MERAPSALDIALGNVTFSHCMHRLGAVNSFQLTYTATPSAAVCLRSGTEADTAAEIVNGIEQLGSSYNLNCGSWERLN